MKHTEFIQKPRQLNGRKDSKNRQGNKLLKLFSLKTVSLHKQYQDVALSSKGGQDISTVIFILSRKENRRKVRSPNGEVQANQPAGFSHMVTQRKP